MECLLEETHFKKESNLEATMKKQPSTNQSETNKTESNPALAQVSLISN